jgi:glycosyltransferase involved in cell wall biosynthesis
MWCGKPGVSTRLGGIPELVEEILVEPGDVESLRAALRRLVDDPRLRATQGARNRRIAAQKCSRDNIVAMRNLLLNTGIREQAGCLQDLQTGS